MAAPVHTVEVVGHEDAGAAVRALLLQALHLAGVVDLQTGSRSEFSDFSSTPCEMRCISDAQPKQPPDALRDALPYSPHQDCSRRHWLTNPRALKPPNPPNAHPPQEAAGVCCSCAGKSCMAFAPCRTAALAA